MARCSTPAPCSPEEARPLLYTICASFPGHPYPRLANPADPADLVLDLAPVLEKKIGLIGDCRDAPPVLAAVALPPASSATAGGTFTAVAIEPKIAAAICHRSQHALFVRRRTPEWGRPVQVPEAVLAVEGVSRLWPDGPGEDKIFGTLEYTARGGQLWADRLYL